MGLNAFRQLLAFQLDDFQERACEAVASGAGVLVAAPTGSGKTVVGEFAVHLAVESGTKCFYTTPIKALSNQKFHDLVERYGPEQVGLLTGDNSINGEAPVVVMTTEVLRNMLYAGSRTLAGLRYVVMDEVHYLADRSRGPVWEEVIINLAESVSVVSLSATVSNAEEFGEWLTEVRGHTITIVEERRPVPLHQHVMVGRTLHDLFEPPRPGDAEPRVSHTLEHLARDAWPRTRDRRAAKGDRPRDRHRAPGRVEVVERLNAARLLPAIVFIFSRAGCDAAVEQVLAARLALTTPHERELIEKVVDAACAKLPETDLAALGFDAFRTALAHGIASHHAGMLPTFKEVVEELFTHGLVKVVFATETLALGINMPARTVVIERLSKWNGQTHVDLTPGEYTQLTGRAGRRGLDVEGHGVVLWQQGLSPKHVAGLASTRTYPLASSFRPSYNMAVNLVGQSGRHVARELLEQSFAQFQADRAVVGLARRIHKSEEALEGYKISAECHLGDFMEYAQLRRALTDAEAQGRKRRRAADRRAIAASLAPLRRGDVIVVPTGKFAGPAVVLDPGPDRDDPHPQVLTANRHARRLALIDFNRPVTPVGTLRVPKGFNPRNAQSRRELANRLRQIDIGAVERPRKAPAEVDPAVDEIRVALRDHPCHSCPDRESHARWAERYLALERETADNRRRIEARTNTVARQFDRVCEVLTALDYLRGDEVTEAGHRLQRLYGELDLVVSECLQHRAWEGLDPAELAAVASALTFTARSDEPHSGEFATPAVRAAAERMLALWSDLVAQERKHRVEFLRPMDFGFAAGAAMWASGRSLDEVLAVTELPAGDFVRAVNQLLDLLGQVADAAGESDLRGTARAAIGALRRGVLAL